MNKILKKIVLIGLLLSLAVFTQAQNFIYHDNFIPGQTKWQNHDDENYSAKFDAGKYAFTNKNNAYSIKTIGNEVKFDNNRDYRIETTVTHLGGTDQLPMGLVFACKDIVNLYYLAISANGYYIFSGCVNGVNTQPIIPWTLSSAIKTGNNVANKLRIEKAGDQLKLIINDQLLSTVPMVQPLGDAIGVLVAGQQTAAFDELTAEYTSKPVIKLNPVNNSIAETVYHTDFSVDDDSKWTQQHLDSAKTSIGSGGLNIFCNAKSLNQNFLTSPKTLVDMGRNFLIETEAIYLSGEENHPYGLEFGCDSIRQYHFAITASGYYSILYTEGKSFAFIVNYTTSDAIVKGANAKNKLSIEHKNGQFHFYINDQLIESYPEIKFTGHRFGVSAGPALNVGFGYLTFGYLEKTIHIVNTDTVSIPKVYITSPEVTRGLQVVQSSNILHVAGNAKDASGIFSVQVNEIAATLDATTGNFTADVPMAIGNNTLLVTARNMNMVKGTYTFHVVRNAVPAAEQKDISHDAGQGKYYALLIGVQNYNDSNIPSLEGPLSDIGKLAQTLVTYYTFPKENIQMLPDPKREEFYKTMDDFAKIITPDDNLLIFYAGHGFYDKAQLQGYWFPKDAIYGRRDTYIANSDLLGYITAIKSKHTLLISDACFSGSIFKSRSVPEMPKDIEEVYKLPSRKAITSGMAEVPDKSVFMDYLIKKLEQNTDPYLTTEYLFATFKAAVINNSQNSQVPQFGEIRGTGDEGGDFVFVKKN